MTLVELRRKFVELSGRYDLVSNTSTWADSGANFFINAGQNYLDRIITVPESKATVFYPLAINEYYITFQQRCRAILEVWVYDSEERTLVEKHLLKDIKEYYSGIVSTIEAGRPLYYAPANLRSLADAGPLNPGIFLDVHHLITDDKYNYRGIVLAPPADQSYMVEILGLFNQPVLTLDTQENYWTLEVPELLLKSALYQLETFYRNTEGANDWMRAIQLEVMELDKDTVEEDISDLDDMGE